MDTGTHLLGSTRLLNSASTFASQGGIGEAASWIVLRQCLYLSITRSQPLRINLGNYKASAAFRDSEPESMANRIILLCAQILTPAVDARQGLDAETWGVLGREVDMWRGEVDWPFAPDEDGVGDGVGEGVPDLWVALPVHGKELKNSTMQRKSLTVLCSDWTSALLSCQAPLGRIRPSIMGARTQGSIVESRSRGSTSPLPIICQT